MPARFMKTPFGRMEIRPGIVEVQARMTDRQVADAAFAGSFIDPEAFAELAHRGLCSPGMFQKDVYRLIEQREAEAHAPCHLN